MENGLIVALDTGDKNKIERLSEQLQNIVPWMKIGFQAFSLLGLDCFKTLEADGYQVFLDLKFHDIPNTTARDIGMISQTHPTCLLYTSDAADE